MKLRKFRCSPQSWAAPSIHATPSTSETSTASVPFFDAVASVTTIATAQNATAVASGPSRSSDRIISANTVARLTVSTRVPSFSRMPSIVSEMRSKA